MIKPPTSDMVIAGIPIIELCASTIGSAMPLKTRNPVKKRPKSSTALLTVSPETQKKNWLLTVVEIEKYLRASFAHKVVIAVPSAADSVRHRGK